MRATTRAGACTCCGFFAKNASSSVSKNRGLTVHATPVHIQQALRTYICRVSVRCRVVSQLFRIVPTSLPRFCASCFLARVIAKPCVGMNILAQISVCICVCMRNVPLLPFHTSYPSCPLSFPVYIHRYMAAIRPTRSSYPQPFDVAASWNITSGTGQCFGSVCDTKQPCGGNNGSGTCMAPSGSASHPSTHSVWLP